VESALVEPVTRIAKKPAVRADPPDADAPTTSPRDIHGALRRTERDVEVDRVWREGDMYVQSDGQIARVLDNGDGTYSVVIRDMSNPSGAPTTVIPDLTQSQLDGRINRGDWE
jgi:hypothetical protein